VTNALIIEDDGNLATVRSKGIGVLADGTSRTVICEDDVRGTTVRPLHP
jgi:hypothetical protein